MTEEIQKIETLQKENERLRDKIAVFKEAFWRIACADSVAEMVNIAITASKEPD